MIKPTTGHLSEKDWQFVEKHMPIVCVDLLIWRVLPNNIIEIGLIERDTPHQGRRWCLPGGRVWRNEELIDTVLRQIGENFGDKATLGNTPPKLLGVFEYFTLKVAEKLHDPRKHVISLVYSCSISGKLAPNGEAIDFRWFPPDIANSAEMFGFDQSSVVNTCVKTLLSTMFDEEK